MSILLALFSLTPMSTIPDLYPGTENLSTTRQLKCWEGTGSAFIVGENIIATAAHVAQMTGCRDAETLAPFKTVKLDMVHDFAMMVGKTPVMHPVEIDCGGYKTGRTYKAYGITRYQQPSTLHRVVSLKATATYDDLAISNTSIVMKEIRLLMGYIVPGMSGGPIKDPETGKVVGLVNAGMFGMFGPAGYSYSYEMKETSLCKA